MWTPASAERHFEDFIGKNDESSIAAGPTGLGPPQLFREACSGERGGGGRVLR